MKKLLLLLFLIPLFSFSQTDSLKLEDKSTEKTRTEINPSVNPAEPLYVVDGKIVDKTAVEELNPDEIEFINVLKGEKAIEKYGEAGKNGVVEIHLKTNIEVSISEKLENKMPISGLTGIEIPEISKIDAITMSSKQFPGTVCQASVRTVSKPNIVLDGELVSEDFLKNIDPNNIESITVLKSSSTINLCRRGYDDTILIKTKDSTEYDLDVLDLGYQSFLAMQPSVGTYSLNYLTNKNRHYVSVWNSRVMSGNPEIYEMPIDYNSQTYYGLEFEYKLFMFFKFMEDKHKISFI